jgi:hypothetical protein
MRLGNSSVNVEDLVAYQLEVLGTTTHAELVKRVSALPVDDPKIIPMLLYCRFGRALPKVSRKRFFPWLITAGSVFVTTLSYMLGS